MCVCESVCVYLVRCYKKTVSSKLRTEMNGPMGSTSPCKNLPPFLATITRISLSLLGSFFFRRLFVRTRTYSETKCSAASEREVYVDTCIHVCKSSRQRSLCESKLSSAHASKIYDLQTNLRCERRDHSSANKRTMHGNIRISLIRFYFLFSL